MLFDCVSNSWFKHTDYLFHVRTITSYIIFPRQSIAMFHYTHQQLHGISIAQSWGLSDSLSYPRQTHEFSHPPATASLPGRHLSTSPSCPDPGDIERRHTTPVLFQARAKAHPPQAAPTAHGARENSLASSCWGPHKCAGGPTSGAKNRREAKGGVHT